MPHIRPLESLSVQGCIVPAGQTILLKPVKKSKNIRDGFLRVHNVSKEPQPILPSKTAQKQWPEFQPEIMGDDFHASMPMAWNNPALRFEIISMNNSLLPGGTRVLLEAEKFVHPGSTWAMQEIICAVKELPGSRPPGPTNPNNYMGYDRTNWQVFDQDVQEGFLHSVDGIVMDETFVSEGKTTANEMAYVVQTLGKKLAFVVEKSDGASYEHKTDTLGRFLDSIGTAGCISLIQKAIRRRPAMMKHPETEEEFETPEIVERITRRMCCGRETGFFLPLIGKFVTPLQHFLKRLFIIAAEDSSYCPQQMFFVSMKALLACELPHWRPSSTLVDKFCSTALELLYSSQTSEYDTSVSLSLPNDFVAAAPARVQAALGGMGGDQKMLRWLAKKPHNTVGTAGQPLNGCDPLDIYCDQHQEGRLVCFLEKPVTTKQPNVFQKAEESAFFAVSGHNTRRAPRLAERTCEQQMVFDGLRASSKLLRMSTSGLPERAPFVQETKDWSVAEGALAGMVGALEVCLSGARYFVTVSTHDLETFVVIPKPSRDNKKHMSDITPADRDRIVAIARRQLRKGVTAGNVSDASFKGAKIRLVDGQWLVRGISWSEARHLSTVLTKTIDWSKLTAAHEGHWSWTETFGDGQIFRPEAIQWCIGRMAGYGTTVSIPKINRMGAGTDEALTGLEAEGYQFMRHLSEHYPDALWPARSFTFVTRCIALRKEICARLSAISQSSCQWPQWTSHLSLRPTQQMAFNDMRTAHEHGLASFLWMLVGQGKTLTVLSFLEATRTCKHVIWSLPKSAVGSVAEIIHEVGWRPLLLFPSKGLQKKYEKEAIAKQLANPSHRIWPSTTNTTLTNNVTIIEHDHLRKLADPLAAQMGDTAFIFDEVHKAMQTGTQRTAAALRLARLAKQLVALTGTPIVDKSGYGLMEWLRLCVPFPVTASNFWTAANSMVSQLNSGDVRVTDEVIDVVQTVEDTLFFKENFPVRAPWYGKTEVPTRKQWLQMRSKTNAICDAKIVEMASQMVAEHPANWREDHAQALQGNCVSQRPLIVAQDQRHACQLVSRLIQQMPASDILLVGGSRPKELSSTVAHHKTIHLTEQHVLDGLVPPYKVVVAALRNCEGYSLTWMTCLITGSYPSNQASRTQMRGRINRLDAQRLDKMYWTVLAGVTTITHHYQEAVKLMEDALRTVPARKKRKH